MKAQKHIFLQMEKDSYIWALRLKIALLKAEKHYFLNVDPKCYLFFFKDKRKEYFIWFIYILFFSEFQEVLLNKLLKHFITKYGMNRCFPMDLLVLAPSKVKK